MTDPVLHDLRAWVAEGDRRALERAYKELQLEARPIVRRREPWLSRALLKDRVMDIVNGLLFPSDAEGRPPRFTRLLPSTELRDAEKARSYRAQTFRNFVIDDQRAEQRHRELEGATDPVAAASIRETRRRRREKQAPSPTAQPSDKPSDRGKGVVGSQGRSAEDRALDRIAIKRAFDKLSNVRHRAMVALEYGFDVTPFVDELASRLNRDPGELLTQIDELPSGDREALVRVFYPVLKPIEAAGENFEREWRRARKELQNAVDEERGA